MKLLLLFYDDQINLFQVTIVFMKLLLLFYDDQINLFHLFQVIWIKLLQINRFQVLVCSWNVHPYFMMCTSVFMKLLLLSYDDQINLFRVLMYSWNFYSFYDEDIPVSTTIVFMKAFTFILWSSDKRVSSNSVMMQVLVCSSDVHEAFKPVSSFKYYCVHESFTLILWWSDQLVSSNNVFMKLLLLFYDDQINLCFRY